MNLLIIFLVILSCSFDSSLTTIMINFPKITSYFKEKMTEGCSMPNPLKGFSFRSRRILCDAVIKARLFVGMRYSNAHINNLNESTFQQQRLETHFLLFESHRVRTTGGFINVDVLQCVSFPIVRYIAFGFETKLIYFFEPNENKSHASLIVIAILEPDALLQSPNTRPELTDYFLRALSSEKGLMETSRPRVLKRRDRIRMCSSLYAVLTAEGFLPNLDRRVNDVKFFYTFPKRDIKVQSFVFSAHVRPCSVNGNNKFPQFYALIDPLEVGSVFILFPLEFSVLSKPILTLRAHVRKVATFLD